MISPLLELERLEISTSEISRLWQASHLYLQLGKIHHSLTIAYSIVQQDTTQEQNYHQHYLKSMRLGAELAEEIENYQLAAHYWQQLTQLLPQDVTSWHGLGVAKANLKDYQTAEFALNQALQLEPGNQKLKIQLSEIKKIIASPKM